MKAPLNITILIIVSHILWRQHRSFVGYIPKYHRERQQWHWETSNTRMVRKRRQQPKTKHSCSEAQNVKGPPSMGGIVRISPGQWLYTYTYHIDGNQWERHKIGDSNVGPVKKCKNAQNKPMFLRLTAAMTVGLNIVTLGDRCVLVFLPQLRQRHEVFFYLVPESPHNPERKFDASYVWRRWRHQ